MIDYLGILIKKYGGILIAGVAGAIIRRIDKNNRFKNINYIKL